MSSAHVGTVRVEEDLHLVDEVARTLAPCADEVVERLGDSDRWSVSLDDCSLVSSTARHSGLDALVDEVRGNRLRVAQAAAVVDSGDCLPVAAGVVPWPRSAAPVGSREHDIRTRYGLLGRQRTTGGTRIIVECGAPVLDVCRGISRHLPVLLALSASSPFDANAEDTGYASSRLLGWRRWPTSGVFPPAATMEEYRADIAFLQETRVITDPGMMYYDVRPGGDTGEEAGTVEIRLCDAASSAETVGVLTALGRALVEREASLVAAGTPTAPLSPLQQRTATWRAARSGLEGELLDPESLRQRPAEDVVSALIDLLHTQLGEDAAWVRTQVHELLRAGSGAYRQRRALRRRGRADDVIGLLAAETLGTVELEDAVPSTTLGLAAYEPSSGDEFDSLYGAEFWDEAVDFSGEPRPASAAALRTAVGMGTLRLRSRLQESEEELNTRGVTFRASGTDQHLVFPIDPVPRIIGEDTWNRLATGVEQRMRAINAFLDDSYNDRAIVKAGVMDIGTLERAPGFRRVGRHAPAGRVRNHISGADLVCSDDGRWQILEDNVRMPSGLTFALAARDVTRTHFPELLAATEEALGEVVDPDGSLETMCATLRMAAPEGIDPSDAHVVVATAGTDDSTFAEQ
ncbi:MAG: glutamate-cysteine ligase family protein, partial [Corynebacterium sp.]